MASDRTFELGLVMAGAISAGAYSAGVADFLFEALDAYEEEKRKPGWDGPIHDVRISDHVWGLGRRHDLGDLRAAGVP